MTIRIKKDQFSGTSKVFSRDPDGLAAILRGLAIDMARNRLNALNPTVFTDNSTGTAADPYVLVNAPIAPSGVFNALVAGGVQLTAFNSSLGTIANAHAVMAAKMNPVLAIFGLPQITYISGTIASAGTIPAQSTTATTASGAAAVNNASYAAGATIMAANHRLIAQAWLAAMNAMGEAIGVVQGVDPLISAFETPFVPSAPITSFTPSGLRSFGPAPQNYILAATPTVTADATGASSVSLADGTAYLAAIANNLATMAKGWNQGVIGTTLSALTDSTTGTASQEAVAAIAAPVAYTSAGTDLAPKAGFDAQLALYANAQASIAARINLASGYQALGPILTDNTGGTATATLAAMSSALTAVAGSAGTGVASATAITSWTAVVNNMSTLIAAANKLCPYYDLTPLVDSSGGTASPGTPAFKDEAGLTETPMESVAAVNPVLVVVPATGTAITNGTLDSIANTQATTFLAEGMNAIATIAALVNKMLATTPLGEPLNVVAR
jgi:hypothetical protein